MVTILLGKVSYLACRIAYTLDRGQSDAYILQWFFNTMFTSIFGFGLANSFCDIHNGTEIFSLWFPILNWYCNFIVLLYKIIVCFFPRTAVLHGHYFCLHPA
jgi:hypothetical protein